MNVFISRPTKIANPFELQYKPFEKLLKDDGFEVKRLGSENYSMKAPLHAVIDLINECSGAIVLGYPQVEFQHEARRGPEVQSSIQYSFPTPWNQIEGSLAFSLQAPTLIVAHPGISGGVFDPGITGEAVLRVDLAARNWFKKPEFTQPYRQWLEKVSACAQKPAKPTLLGRNA